jgi:hypothetical protein
MKKFTRRDILKATVPSSLAMLAMPTIIPSTAFGANDRMRVAVIGINGRGKDHIKGFMSLDNVEVATICDVDNVVLKAGAKAFEEKYNKKVNIEEGGAAERTEERAIDASESKTDNDWFFKFR